LQAQLQAADFSSKQTVNSKPSLLSFAGMRVTTSSQQSLTGKFFWTWWTYHGLISAASWFRPLHWSCHEGGALSAATQREDHTSPLALKLMNIK